MKKKTFARAIATSTLALSLAAAAPLAASAHVRIDPGQATPGSYTTLTFKVPTESATASTVKLEVDLPADTPFGSVSYQPVPGWTTEIVTSTLATPVVTDDATVTEAPSKITWTATGDAAIAPGQFQLFSVSVGPVPDTGSIVMPTHQTYSDGSVVDWSQPTPATGVEPENPAPTLYVDDAPPVEAAAGTTGSPSPSVSSSAVAGDGAVATQGTPLVSTADSSTDTIALLVGVAGLALGAVALVLAVYAVTRSRAARR